MDSEEVDGPVDPSFVLTSSEVVQLTSGRQSEDAVSHGCVWRTRGDSYGEGPRASQQACARWGLSRVKVSLAAASYDHRNPYRPLSKRSSGDAAAAIAGCGWCSVARFLKGYLRLCFTCLRCSLATPLSHSSSTWPTDESFHVAPGLRLGDAGEILSEPCLPDV